MDSFPFPSREQALDVLKSDPVFRKIQKDEAGLRAVADTAWDTGEAAARDILENNPGRSIRQIVKACGVAIHSEGKDNVVGKVRYFSDYYSGEKKRIVLYTVSINKWAAKNGFSRREAEEIILAHELFHHLECTKLGLTSKQCLVPILRIGGLSIGETGVRALSEIGSFAFARTCFDLLIDSGDKNTTEQ